MRRKLSLLLAVTFLLGVLTSSAWAAQSDQVVVVTPAETPLPGKTEGETQGSGAGETGEKGETQQPGENGESGASGETPANPEEDPANPEPAEPTLEELRDTLFAILGTGEETQGVRDQVDRMVALGDPTGSVRQWLELTIKKYQMEEELRKVTDELTGLETGDGELGAIAEAVAALAVTPDELLTAIEAISPGAAELLKSLAPEDLETFRLPLSALVLYDDGTPAGRQFAAVRILLAIRDSELLDAPAAGQAQSLLVEALSGLTAMGRTFTGAQREKLESASRDIASRANLASACSPLRLVPVGKTLRYQHPLFTYHDAVMLSIPDAAQFLGGKVVQEGDMVAILAPDTVLELVKGSSDGYLNDKLCKLASPVLTFDGVCYLPLDTVLACCGMARITVENYELLYTPLPQAETPEETAALGAAATENGG